MTIKNNIKEIYHVKITITLKTPTDIMALLRLFSTRNVIVAMTDYHQKSIDSLSGNEVNKLFVVVVIVVVVFPNLYSFKSEMNHFTF